jgi:hypothetical protein
MIKKTLFIAIIMSAVLVAGARYTCYGPERLSAPRARATSWGDKTLEFSRQVEDTLLCGASVARAMSIGVQFSPGWYALFVAFFLAWLMLALFRRKGVERKEAKEQFVLGLLGSCALVSMEIFATSTNLWTYVPQNWPVMLWPTYFVAILFGYQLLRLVEGFFSKNTPAR